MDILTISQIVLNITLTAVVLVVGLLIAVIAFNVIKLIKSIKKLSSNISAESAKVYQQINNVIAGASAFPFVAIISRLFKKRK